MNARKRWAIVALLLAAPLAFGGVYKWVDENGQVHFGDKVPEKYRDQTKSVTIKTTRPSAEQIKEAEARAANAASTSDAIRSTEPESSSRPSAPTKTAPAPSSCADQMARYYESQRCFDQYRNENGSLDSGASRCQNLKRPSC